MTHVICIADDNSDTRTIYTIAFRDSPYEIVIFADGQEVLDYLQEHTPHLLLLDVNMPRVSGLDVLRYVREQERFAGSRVIMVTSNAPASQSPEAQLADLVLVKPVDIFELKTLVERLLPRA